MSHMRNICDKKNNQLEHVFIFSAVTFPTSYQRVTVHVSYTDMSTNIIIRYDLLVLLNFYIYDVAIPDQRFMNISFENCSSA